MPKAQCYHSRKKAVTWDRVEMSFQVQGLALILFLFQQEGNYYVDWQLAKSLCLIQDILTSIFLHVFPCLPKTQS